MNKNNINNQSVSYYLRNINKYKTLPKDKVKEIFIRKKNGEDNEFDKDEIITGNLKLVVSIAKRFRNATPYLNFTDLISAGNLGLFRAYEKYDVDKGKEFSTYATFWIRHHILREISRNKHTVRRPIRLVESYEKFLRDKKELEAKYKREFSQKELSEKMNIPESDICCFWDINKIDSAMPQEELLGKDDIDNIELNWLIKRLNEIIKKESFKNKTIIRLKLGFTKNNNYREPMMVSDIAKKVNMSIEGVRQIALRLTNKIKRRLANE